MTLLRHAWLSHGTYACRTARMAVARDSVS